MNDSVMPEYLKFRCCMCPNMNTPYNTVCPPKPFDPQETPCRFVKMYIDKRGWKYKVMGGLSINSFKVRYQDDKHTGGTGWKCVKTLPWRETFDEAQADLKAYAKKKGMKEWTG